MADGRHIGFGFSTIRAMMVEKHLGCDNFNKLVFISDITPDSSDIVSQVIVDIVDVAKCP